MLIDIAFIHFINHTNGNNDRATLLDTLFTEDYFTLDFSNLNPSTSLYGY